MLGKVSEWGVPYTLLRTRSEIPLDGTSERRLTIGDTETVEISSPQFPDVKDATGTYDIPANHVDVYTQASLLGGPDPIALTSGGKPVLGVARNLEFDALRQLRDAGRLLGWATVARELFVPGRSVMELEASFDVLVPFTRRNPELNYYHWITEFLPRVRGVFAYEETRDVKASILLEPDPPTWIRESLDLVGVASGDCVEWSGGKVQVAELVVPRFNRKGFPRPFEPSRADLAWVREQMTETVDRSAGRNADRLFVSREDADERRLENRGEIVEVVEEYGFEVIIPSELSVAEQVASFRSAEIVLGPHGAGLTNVLFAEDATLIELFPGDYTPIYFYMIAGMFDMGYECLVGDEATPDFTVSADAVEDLLARVTVRSGE